jgi:hypothetical protein
VTLQNRTLHRYRQLFPQKTLKEISLQTGIQITRVFRLFNGKTMKVKELEAFEEVIARKLSQSPNYAGLNLALEEASAFMSNDELGKLLDHVQRRIKLKSYARLSGNENHKDANIA